MLYSLFSRLGREQERSRRWWWGGERRRAWERNWQERWEHLQWDWERENHEEQREQEEREQQERQEGEHQEGQERERLLRQAQLRQQLEAPPGACPVGLSLNHLSSLMFLLVLAALALELVGWFMFLGLLVTIRKGFTLSIHCASHLGVSVAHYLACRGHAAPCWAFWAATRHVVNKHRRSCGHRPLRRLSAKLRVVSANHGATLHAGRSALRCGMVSSTLPPSPPSHTCPSIASQALWLSCGHALCWAFRAATRCFFIHTARSVGALAAFIPHVAVPRSDGTYPPCREPLVASSPRHWVFGVFSGH
ncbi:hypothetical protein FB451DRAFT_1494442 [Mycena latifolia]|nr:hypothetical protein FB451DRAFT_1494442 [Mycena latifolia]